MSLTFGRWKRLKDAISDLSEHWVAVDWTRPTRLDLDVMQGLIGTASEVVADCEPRRIRPKSERRAKVDRRRAKALNVLIDRDGVCQLGPWIATVDPAHRCLVAHQLHGHEPLKRSATGGEALDRMLADPSLQVLACDPCNGWVEENPLEARQLDLSAPGQTPLAIVEMIVAKICAGPQ